VANNDLVEAGKTKPKGRVVNEYHSPTSKVTIAFPFSQITTQEASDELRELARIVAGLTEEIGKLHPCPETDLMVERARGVVTKLG
jgi:hypothetical protein